MIKNSNEYLTVLTSKIEQEKDQQDYKQSCFQTGISFVDYESSKQVNVV